MSMSQFIKSVAAFFGPLLTVFFVNTLGDWKYIFLAYSGLSLLSLLLLSVTPVREKAKKETPARFADCFSLLGNKFVLFMVLGIFIVVGLDVGMNTGVPRFLEKYGLSAEQAVKGISVFYIFSLMASRFLGAVILKKVAAHTFLILSAFLTIAGVALLAMGISSSVTKIAIVIIGLGSANIFPLIFSISVEKMPERSNEISGLMIMAISGGALFPLLMGIIVDQVSLTASIIFLLIITCYLGFISLWSRKATHGSV
jgi:FHS family L-fucose permease-like MFS transporter